MEQPNAGMSEITEDGGSSISEILNKGLKGGEDGPETVSQAEEGVEGNQPGQDAEGKTEAEKVEELFGELVLDDAKKFSFKSKEELEAFIERNREILEKTGYGMRQADYTRKTQALKQEREAFERERQETESFWGPTKPDQESMTAFKSLWDVFLNSDQGLQGKINSFMQDVVLLANGKAPIGPLGGDKEASSSVSPEIIAMRRELQQLKAEREREKQVLTKEQQDAQFREAEKSWKSWTARKESEGVKITDEVEKAMVPYIQATDPGLDADERLDIAFDLASKKLGLDGKLAAKKVFAEAKNAKKTSPAMPTSKAPSAKTPDTKNLSDIFKNGQALLATA